MRYGRCGALVVFVGVVLSAGAAGAGGPLATCGDEYVVYDSGAMPIPYSPDQGMLGNLSNTQAVQLVDEAFGVWQDVPTASLQLQNSGALPVDVTADNFLTYYDAFEDGVNPIVFDSDGAIIEYYIGYGASADVIGFAGSASDPGTCRYTEGIALLNGRFTEVFTFEQFKATFVHEFGHFVGLDHCQINTAFAGDGNTSNDIYLPTMFPTATDDDTPLGDLNPDDAAALTMLYPLSEAVVAGTYGTISGRVLWRDGSAVHGANVVACKTDDEYYTCFSSVSDYFQQDTGEYRMLVLPGTYRLFIEPVNRYFTGGSSVGPYAETLWSESFTLPVRPAWYSGEVTVAAGETVADIDFVARHGRIRLCPISLLVQGNLETLESLRQVRDTLLVRSRAGRRLVQAYYRHAATINGMFERHPMLLKACRTALRTFGASGV